MDKSFFVFIYFLIGLYVAHFFVQEFDFLDVVRGWILIVLPLAFILWPAFMISWCIVAIMEMHRRR